MQELGEVGAGWRQRSATSHVLYVSPPPPGQLAERVCKFPQVEPITVASGDLSGSRGRHELMEVGSTFLTLLASLENPVQETCGHYLISASLTPDFHGLIVKTPDCWNEMIRCHVALITQMVIKEAQTLAQMLGVVYLWTSGLLQTFPYPHGGVTLGTWWPYREKFINSFYRWGNETLGCTFCPTLHSWDLFSKSSSPLKPRSSHLVVGSLNGSPGFPLPPPFRISFLLHCINIATIWRLSCMLWVCFHERWFYVLDQNVQWMLKFQNSRDQIFLYRVSFWPSQVLSNSIRPLFCPCRLA